MKKSTQHLIAEVPRRQTKVELTIGVDLGDVWSHCRERSVPTGFNELRLVAVMAWKNSGFIAVTDWNNTGTSTNQKQSKSS
jgi:hypothetical protein